MAVSVPCPSCRKKLKLPDERLLGRVVTCPACRKRVKLPKDASATPSTAAPSTTPAAEPKRREVRSPSRKDPVSRSSPPSDRSPKRSSQAPSEGERRAAASVTTGAARSPAAADAVAEPPLGLNARYVQFAEAVPANSDVATAEFSLEDSPSQTIPTFDALVEKPTDEAAAFDAAFTSGPVHTRGAAESGSTLAGGSPADASQRLVERRKRRKRSNAILGVAGVLALAAVGGGLLMLRPDRPPRRDAAATPVVADPPAIARPAVASPTSGEPVPTTLLPAGVGVLVHVRAADVWGGGGPMAGLRAALPPSLLPTAEAAITRLAGVPVSEIEEATLGVVLGARGVPPRLCGAFRLRTGRDVGRWLQELGGQSQQLGGEARLVRGDELATLILDDRTFGVAPVEFAEDLADAATVPSQYLSAAMAPVVPATDRTRHLSIAAGVTDLDIHAAAMLPPAAADFLLAVIDAVGPEAEAACWSVHAGDELYSELTLRPRRGVGGSVLEGDVRKMLEALPQRLSAQLRGHRPAGGTRKITGRLPAMMEAARRSSDIDSPGGLVRVRTLLPAKAGPNLALATVYSHNLLATTPATPAASAAPAVDRRTIEQRLQTPVDAEFTRMPLQEAMAYLAGESGLTIELDGEGLKLAGYTQNMPQNFTLGIVPAREAIGRIVGQYPKMRVVADEVSRTLTVTTVDALEGRTPLEF